MLPSAWPPPPCLLSATNSNNRSRATAVSPAWIAASSALSSPSIVAARVAEAALAASSAAANPWRALRTLSISSLPGGSGACSIFSRPSISATAVLKLFVASWMFAVLASLVICSWLFGSFGRRAIICLTRSPRRAFSAAGSAGGSAAAGGGGAGGAASSSASFSSEGSALIRIAEYPARLASLFNVTIVPPASDRLTVNLNVPGSFSASTVTRPNRTVGASSRFFPAAFIIVATFFGLLRLSTSRRQSFLSLVRPNAQPSGSVTQWPSSSFSFSSGSIWS